jgi:hypothetical protein
MQMVTGQAITEMPELFYVLIAITMPSGYMLYENPTLLCCKKMSISKRQDVVYFVVEDICAE